jgi:hypothetical protein
MFYDTATNSDIKICENCYRESHHGQATFVKVYKHCVLNQAITPKASRNICYCDTVPHFAEDGRSRHLFPVDKDDKHRNIDNGGIQCGLLKLGELVTEAKYGGMRECVKADKKSSRKIRLAEVLVRDRRLKKEIQGSPQDTNQRIPEKGSTTTTADKEAHEDVPLFFRKYTERYPFGN